MKNEKVKNKTPDEKINLIGRYEELIKSGKNPNEAAQSMGISKQNIYNWRYDLFNKRKRTTVKRVRRKSAPIEVIDLETAPPLSSNRIIAFIGSVNDVVEATRRLA